MFEVTGEPVAQVNYCTWIIDFRLISLVLLEGSNNLHTINGFFSLSYACIARKKKVSFITKVFVTNNTRPKTLQKSSCALSQSINLQSIFIRFILLSDLFRLTYFYNIIVNNGML